MLNTECWFNITRVLKYLIAYNAVLAVRYWMDVYLYISVICIKNCIQKLGFYLHRWMIECKVTTSSSAQVNPFHLCSIRFIRVKSPRRPQKKHTRDGHMWTVLICKVCATSTVHQREPSTVLYEPAPFTCYMMLGSMQNWSQICRGWRRRHLMYQNLVQLHLLLLDWGEGSMWLVFIWVVEAIKVELC